MALTLVAMCLTENLLVNSLKFKLLLHIEDLKVLDTTNQIIWQNQTSILWYHMQSRNPKWIHSFTVLHGTKLGICNRKPLFVGTPILSALVVVTIGVWCWIVACSIAWLWWKHVSASINDINSPLRVVVAYTSFKTTQFHLIKKCVGFSGKQLQENKAHRGIFIKNDW